jgi:hypothetical protein
MKDVNGKEITEEMLDDLCNSMPYLSRDTFKKWFEEGFIRKIEPCLSVSTEEKEQQIII